MARLKEKVSSSIDHRKHNHLNQPKTYYPNATLPNSFDQKWLGNWFIKAFQQIQPILVIMQIVGNGKTRTKKSKRPSTSNVYRYDRLTDYGQCNRPANKPTLLTDDVPQCFESSKCTHTSDRYRCTGYSLLDGHKAIETVILHYCRYFFLNCCCCFF